MTNASKYADVGDRVKVVETRTHRGKVGVVIGKRTAIGCAGDWLVIIRQDSGEEFYVWDRQVRREP